MALIVNGEKIEDSTIQREVERLRPDYEKVFKDQRPEEQKTRLLDWSRENVIERVLLEQESKKHCSKIPEDEVQALMARLRKPYDSDAEFYRAFNADDDEKVKEIISSVISLERLFDDTCKDMPELSKEAVLEFYEDNKEQFKSAERVRVAHIVKHINWQTDEAAACSVIKKVRDELDNGALFEMLAAKYSDCPEDGGELGYITRGQMVEEFDDVVFNLDVGQVSKVFRTRFGYHIAKLYDRKPAVIPPLGEIRDEIANELKEQMRSKAIDEFVDRLKNKAKIEEL